jgi:hypothetical protein
MKSKAKSAPAARRKRETEWVRYLDEEQRTRVRRDAWLAEEDEQGSRLAAYHSLHEASEE